MEPTLHAFPAARRLAAGWLLLALGALALSTLCALLLIAARTPALAALGASPELFRRALVLHVSLAVVVWFLSCAAAWWTLAAAAPASAVRWSALALAVGGVGAMAAALFAAGGAALLANYVPVLDHPLFLAGLVLFLSGVALCGAASLRALLAGLRAGAPWRIAALLSLLAGAMALAAVAAGLARNGAPHGLAGFELLVWGPGHLLQFVHVILLIGAWSVLGEQVFGQALAPRRYLAGLLLLAALPVLAAPWIYASHAPASPAFRSAFTTLMAAGCWPAPALLALRVLQQFVRGGRAAWAAPLAPALLLSALLFLLGCVLGALIRADSTMVPAHYHGTVGAVTLAYMALGYHLLPGFGARAGALLTRWQSTLYGGGLLLLALALAWSGSMGVPRKTMHIDVLVQFPAYFAAMGLAGLGGLLAIAGAAAYVAGLARSLAGARRAGGRLRDVRWRAGALTLGLTAAFGLVLASWPGQRGTALPAPAAPQRSEAGAHADAKRAEEVAQRFAQGAALLNARRYQEAAAQLHRVLELAPQLPEAHVNMGFAMLGLQRYGVARDFFGVAIDLQRNQNNAYFGLALALEGLRDLPGALGAMRSYVHLSPADDPYRRKANAALGEWSAALARARAGSGAERVAMPIPRTGNNPLGYPIREKRLN